ncbi:MAG: helix-turn-helix transcriptional regulator [Vicingaceae bacterium]
MEQKVDTVSNLTARETQILKLIAEGYSNTQIGKLLGISHRTVDTHRTNIRNKLGVSGLAGMIRYALKEQIID